MKKLVSIIMSFILLFSTCQITSFANEVTGETDENSSNLTKTVYRFREKEYTSSTERLSEPWIQYNTTTEYKHGSKSYVYIEKSKGGTSTGYTYNEALEWRLNYDQVYCFHAGPTAVYQFRHKTYFTDIYVTNSNSVDLTKYYYVRDCWRFEICSGKTSYNRYHYYKWSEWSEWSYTPVVSTDDIEVETKEVECFTITFDANGGKDVPSEIIKGYDEEIVLPDVVPAKEGYLFVGWSTFADGEVEYNPGDVFLLNSDTVLYAVWVACEHQWNDGVVVLEPEHTSYGTMEFICLDCGATKTEDIPKLPEHNYSDWKVDSDEQHKKICECGDIVYAIHNWDDGTEIIKPTCGFGGVKKYNCLDCGDSYIENIEATGHTEVVDEAVAPSCTEKGLTEGKHCLVCGVTLCEQIEIEALGHTEVVDKGYQATATKEGLTDGSHCSVCNEVIVKQEIIPVLFILGDVDGDDIVTVLDATYIQLHLAQLVIISDERFDYADADKNGEITILDASLIQRYVAQLIPEL